MRNIFEKLDRIINWLILIFVPLFVLGILWDTIQAFTDPEKYRHVQYQENWIEEGFWIYVFKNILFITAGILFWFSALNKLRSKGLIWNKLYYSVWIVCLLKMTYNFLAE